MPAEDSATGLALLQNPALNKGTAFTEVERDALLSARAPAAARVHAGGAAVARAREFPAQADAAREIHRPRQPSRSQRGAVLPAADRLPGRDAADRLHADGGPRVPAVRPHLPAAARHLRERARPRPGSPGARQLAAAGRGHHRRNRRRAHPGPGGSRRERHGHSGRQARALLRVCGRASQPVPAGPARRRHQQSGAARRPAVLRLAGAASDAAPSTMRWSTNSSPRPASSSPTSSSSSRTSPTTTRSDCSKSIATASPPSTTTSRARPRSRWPGSSRRCG